MNQHNTSTYRYCNIHPSVYDRVMSTNCFECGDGSEQNPTLIQDQYRSHGTCHCHIASNANSQRNNHNDNLIHSDDVSKSIDDVQSRKRRSKLQSSTNGYHRRSSKSSSVLPLDISSILLLLIRLTILCIVLLTICFILYYAVVYISPKPKKRAWEQMIDWLSYE